jgi:hypothetical protein
MWQPRLRVSEATNGNFRRWLFLAWMCETLPDAEGQFCLLEAEDFRQQKT